MYTLSILDLSDSLCPGRISSVGYTYLHFIFKSTIGI